MMRRLLGLLAAGVLSMAHGFSDSGGPADAAEIMARVAANMASGVELRRAYVYDQKVLGRLVRSNGQVARQERREYVAVPGVDRTEKKLTSLAGEYHKSRTELIRYSESGFRKKGMDIDGELLEDLIDDLVDSKKSRDGIPHSLFPFTAKDLPFYKFTLKEPTEVQGRKAYRIAFEPAAKRNCLHIGEGDNSDCPAQWTGEALIDAAEFQPVRVFTNLGFKMPWGVRVFLGTNLRQTGFSVTYARVAENVWFPATYGTEFRLDVLFGYKRVIALSMDSSNFRKAEATSEIKYDIPTDP